MDEDVEYFISAYHNDASAENLCKLIHHAKLCDLVIVSWYITGGYWYIAAILDVNIDDSVNTNNGAGWYLNEEPNISNIPIRHSKIVVDETIGTKTAKVIYCYIGLDSISPLNSSPISQKINSPVKRSSPLISRKHLKHLTPEDSPKLSITVSPDAKSAVDIIHVNPKNSNPKTDTTSNPKTDTNKLDILHFAIIAFIDKLASADLLKRQKSKQEMMLLNISHCVRTPLNSILHTTKVILETVPAEKSKLKQLNQSTVQLANGIFDIVDLAKLELNKLVISKEIFNLKDVIDSVMEIIKNIPRNSKVSVDYLIDSGVPEYIYSDPKRLKQILINLLENSVQHTNRGEVFLHVSYMIIDLASEDARESIVDSDCFQYMISFTIRDTGSGIANSKDLFKPMDISHKQGVSLRISKLLASALDGELKLVSTGPTGTCFELSLIVYDEDQAKTTSLTIKYLNEKTALLLDVGAVKNKCVVSMMEKYRMKYVIADSYNEVLILHADKTFDLVIVCSDIPDELLIKSIKCLFDTKLLGIGQIDRTHLDHWLDANSSASTVKSKFVEIFQDVKNYKNSKILIVDNEQTNRLLLERMLRQLNYKYISTMSSVDSLTDKYDFYILNDSIDKVLESHPDAKILTTIDHPNTVQLDTPIEIRDLDQKIRSFRIST